MFRDLVVKCRSYRRFHEECPVELSTLRELVDLARLSASGNNRQPLKYMLSADAARNATVFSHLRWAASLADWAGPEAGERPTGFVIILGDREISTNFGVDHGIAAHAILLGAVDHGLGGCMFGSVDRNRLRADLDIPERYDILLVVAIGKPKEQIVLEDVPGDANTTYYREGLVHHVPKRRLEEIIVG